MSHPIRQPDHQADVERKAALLEACGTAGKLTVEYHFKDGKWIAGGITVTFPRKHGGEGLTASG
jgi:hypothetical protein